MIQLQTVLVPVDFSDASDSALTYGRTLARTFNARLHLLHVIDDALMFAGADGFSMEITSVINALTDAAEKNIVARLASDDWREPKTLTEVRAGIPAKEIVNYAKEAGIDLIVMGTHGRGFLSRLLMGRVAEKVVRTAPCPVLTVRTPEREFVLRDAAYETVAVAAN